MQTKKRHFLTCSPLWLIFLGWFYFSLFQVFQVPSSGIYICKTFQRQSQNIMGKLACSIVKSNCDFLYAQLLYFAWILLLPSFLSICSWTSSCTSLSCISAWHQWWACMYDALQIWLRAACFVWGTDEGAHIPRGPRFQPRVPAVRNPLLLFVDFFTFSLHSWCVCHSLLIP